MNRQIYEIIDKLSDILPEKRYNHSLGVMYTAQCLAMCHGISLDKAALAGILHDCAKYMNDVNIIQYCKNNNIEVSESEMLSPQLLHSKLGMIFARDVYGITDDEILSAIRYHTTGKPMMSALEQIIFIADYIEPNRKTVKNINIIRKTAYEDLD